MSRFYFLLVGLFMITHVKGQNRVELYPQGIINSVEGVSLGHNIPELYIYKPEKIKSNKIFLILPGGGYGAVAMRHEGHDVAKRLLDSGYTSFLLRYRLPDSKQMHDKRIGPIQDAQRTMVYIKTQAAALGIASEEIVVLGFSAGGHLASTLSTHWDTSYIGPVENDLLRPDYAVLVYPVISMREDITHLGSKTNLIGPNVNEDDVKRFSNELNVNAKTPPTFLVHAEEDQAVPIQNSLVYKEKLDEFGVPNYFYKFIKGVHGFGMYNKDEEGDWLEEMLKWLSEGEN